MIRAFSVPTLRPPRWINIGPKDGVISASFFPYVTRFMWKAIYSPAFENRLESFVLTRSQKRVLAKNEDTRILIRSTSVDEEKAALFLRHRRRFKDNVPSSLNDFLSPYPASAPCLNLELCIYVGPALLGSPFSTSDTPRLPRSTPSSTGRRETQLRHLDDAPFDRILSSAGYRYYYPGYAYQEPFIYDYKKRFIGLEYLDWKTGWKAFAKT